jgi:hypothetical protein
MTSRAFAGTAILAFVSMVSGSAAAQENKPQEGSGAPRPTDPAAQPPPGQGATPATPSEPAPPPALPPPYVAPPSDVALSPVAEEASAGAPYKRRMVFEAALGYTAGGTIKHPELSTHNFSGEMLELAGGVELSPRWVLVIAFTTFQTKLERVGTTNQFQTVSGTLHGGFQPLAACMDCSTGGGLGGTLVKQPMHVHTVGPRLDFLPFGANSLFVGVTVGAAMMQDLSFRGGVAAAARAGFEWRPYTAMGISVEAGAHGQVYSDSSAALPYAALQLTLLAVPPSARVPAAVASVTPVQ